MAKQCCSCIVVYMRESRRAPGLEALLLRPRDTPRIRRPSIVLSAWREDAEHTCSLQLRCSGYGLALLSLRVAAGRRGLPGLEICAAGPS